MPFSGCITSHLPRSSEDHIATPANLTRNEKRSLTPFYSRLKSSLSPFLVAQEVL